MLDPTSEKSPKGCKQGSDIIRSLFQVDNWEQNGRGAGVGRECK